jgi:hypothetical protein
MQAARRLYLYTMSGITLAVIATGLVLLLRVALDGLLPAPDYGGSDGYDNSREQLSQAIAMLGVGTPVWAVHWWLVQRGLRAGRQGRDTERGSAIRAFYVTGVLLISLVVWVPSAIALLQWLATDLLNAVPEYTYANPLGSATVGLAAFAIWLYHGLVRRSDLAAGPVEGMAAWLPRLYLYGVAVGALFVALTSLGTVISATVGQTDFGTDTTYATYYLIQQGITAIGWGLVWLGHWTYATRLCHHPDWRGAEERISRTRVAAFVAVIVAAAGMTITGVSSAIREALVPLVPDPGSPTEGDGPYVLAVLISTLPWVLAWFLHARALRHEPATVDPLRGLHQERLVSHGVAAAALLLGAAGTGWLVGYAIDLLLGGQRTAEGLLPTYDMAQWLPIAVVGLGTWWWSWRRVIARRQADPAGEAGSTIRRTFLYLTLGVALVVALGAAAVILYRLVGLVIDAGLGGNLVSELSTPMGLLLTAGAVLLYHGLTLRSDQRLAVETRGKPAEPESTEPATVGSTPEPMPQRRSLTMTGPAGADLDAALASARAALPPGVEILGEEA